jgi:hypothetical protein
MTTLLWDGIHTRVAVTQVRAGEEISIDGFLVYLMTISNVVDHVSRINCIWKNVEGSDRGLF